MRAAAFEELTGAGGSPRKPPSLASLLAQSQPAATAPAAPPAASAAASRTAAPATGGPHTVASFAARLSSTLGPGLAGVILQPSPPLLQRDAVTGKPHPLDILASAPGTFTDGGGVRIAVPQAHGAAQTERLASQVSQMGGRGVGMGGTLRVSEESFIRAVLALPLCAVMETAVLRALAASGARAGEPLSGTSDGIRAAAGPPPSILPSIPRPRFSDYFGDSADSGPSSAVNGAAAAVAGNAHAAGAGRKQQMCQWPVVWPRYHATFSTLLLEEARGVIASGAEDAARQRLGGGGSRDSQRGGGGGGRRDDLLCARVVCLSARARPLPPSQMPLHMHNTFSDAGSVFSLSFVLHSSEKEGGARRAAQTRKLSNLFSRDVVLLRSTSGVPIDAILEGVYGQDGASSMGSGGPVPVLLGLVDDVETVGGKGGGDADSKFADGEAVGVAGAVAALEEYARGMSRNGGGAGGAEREEATTLVTVRVFVVDGASLPTDFLAAATSERAAMRKRGNAGGGGALRGVAPAPASAHSAAALTSACERIASWHLTRLCSLSTLVQAYGSIAAVAYSPFAAAVLAPSLARANDAPYALAASAGASAVGQNASLPDRPAHIPPPLFRALSRRFGLSQLRAILTAACGGAFVFPDVTVDAVGAIVPVAGRETASEVTTVIGPPGTGKTRTVLGIVSALRATVASTGGAFGPQVHAIAAASLAVTAALAAGAAHTIIDLSVDGAVHVAAEERVEFDCAPVPVSIREPSHEGGGGGALPASHAPPCDELLSPATKRARLAVAGDSWEDHAAAIIASAPADEGYADVISINGSDSDDDDGDSVDSDVVILDAAPPALLPVTSLSANPPVVDAETSEGDDDDDEDDSSSGGSRGSARGGGGNAMFIKRRPVVQSAVRDLKRTRPLAPARPPIVALRATRPIPSSTAGSALKRPTPPLTRRIRILICTPSNAACDEICARLLDLPPSTEAPLGDGGGVGLSPPPLAAEKHAGGLIGVDGRAFIPTVIRTGVGSSSQGGASDQGGGRMEVSSIGIDRHVQRRVATILLRQSAEMSKTGVAGSQGGGASSTSRWPREISDLRARVADVRAAIAAAAALGEVVDGSAATGPRVRYLRREERDFSEALAALASPAAGALGPREAELIRLTAIADVLEGADVVATTLAGSAQLGMLAVRAGAGALSCLFPMNRSSRGEKTGDASAHLLARIAAALAFDACVIDEAGQATEPEALTPFKAGWLGARGGAGATGGGGIPPPQKSGCRRLILVGDPLQLPATVMSHAASTAGLDVSLFERLAGAGVTPLLLRHQYRMPSAIAAFSSAAFYRGLVRDATELGVSRRGDAGGGGSGGGSPRKPRSDDACAARAITLLDVPFGRESRAGADGTSYGNDAEANVVVAIAQHLITALGAAPPPPESTLLTWETLGASIASGGRRPPSTMGGGGGRARKGAIVGVITPYREQVSRVRALARIVLGADVAQSSLVVSSVDGFQGQELDHIIVCAVRSAPPSAAESGGPRSIGFLADARRLNVAITRARESLTLVCNAAHLERSDKCWRDFISHARRVGSVATVQPDGAGGPQVSALCGGLARALESVRARARERV